MNSICEVVTSAQKLQQLLSRALARIGVEDDGDEHAKELTQALAKLYIWTPDQLQAALDDPDVVQDVRQTAIRGMLLPAIRTEIERMEVGGAWRSAMIKAATQKKELNKPLLRRFEVARADFTQLSAIDQVSQTFRARLFLIIRIPNGALDTDLVKDFDGFPFDDDGQPTFRPSAGWYLNQIDFPNGRDINVIESKVTTEKNDLQLIKRVEGEFFEKFELGLFPFDKQDLSITVSILCANEGMVPVEFVSEADSDSMPPQLGVDTRNFAFGDIWELSKNVNPEITTVGATTKRRFPAVHLRACVSRRPKFILLNVAAPTSIIALLSLVTFFVPPEDIANRLDLSITLLLTAVAFKYASAAYLPQISYLTLVDKFCLSCTGIGVLTILCHALLGVLYTWANVRGATLDTANKTLFLLMNVGWMGVQVWFFCRAKAARKSTTDAGQTIVSNVNGEATKDDDSPLSECNAGISSEDQATRGIVCHGRATLTNPKQSLAVK